MEVECIKFFAEIFGMNPNKVDGVLNPGGTMSNMMAFLTARHRQFPHVREEGWDPEDRPIAFSGKQDHYSIRRAAMVAGMGMK